MSGFLPQRMSAKAQVAPDGVTVTNLNQTPLQHIWAAAGITDPQLQHDYATCRALLAHHGKSYALATLTLPPAKRPAVWALYGFARYADEFVDSMTHPDPQRLNQWGNGFQRIAAQVLPDRPQELAAETLIGLPLDPIGRAMVHTMARWGIGMDTVDAFLHSMRMDITVSSYDTHADLKNYMYGSAAVIGLQMLPILEPQHPEANERAIALGEAFQLTNFLRDVGEDLDRGRCYIPLADLADFGLTVTDLQIARASGTNSARIRGALAQVARRTEALYDYAWPGIGMLHPTSQPGIACAFRLYRGILQQVKHTRYDVLSRRVVVPTWQRVAIAAPAALAATWARR